MGEGGDTAGMEKSSALEAYAYGLNGGTAEISVTNRDADDVGRVTPYYEA